MSAAIEQLNTKRRAQAEADGTAFLAVQVGVGVNTGTCVVGNMGSQQRFDYSVVGDAVNLASRLEGQSKPYGVTIVVGPETAATVGAEFALLELDLIAVKGKREAVCIFALLGNAEVRRDTAFRTLTEDHAALLKAYRGQDWPAARGLVDRCRTNRWAPPALYDAYATRIALFQAAPPPADWDGVFVAETK